ncbi:hypothetical protein PHMEG_00013599 [Phytophthora megakarya]|uniref:Uncharacterized protein n=1 Tax=Phytophthora megakarya TaxID=4795 RepID=A0A225W811_9STRA|nr:hypothetical protein PHMEG_00013599 [Phytophthora megakarya]
MQPVTSILHPNTPDQPALNPIITFDIKSATGSARFDEYQERFPQYGKNEPGLHYRIENRPVLTRPGIRESQSVLIICVFNDAASWGENRSIFDFFSLIESFDYPKEKISIALLTSSMQEFDMIKKLFQSYISQYSRLSVIFRNDFVQSGLTRGSNRHEVKLQANRRRMIARYRNYALLLTMETWHQHVLWVDADVKVIPPHLLRKMVLSGLDILTPICFSNFRGNWINYDQNAWVGQRLVRPTDQNDDDFLPGPLNVKLLDTVDDKSKPFAPLDSVGATMLYVRADIHRQGVLFPMHYVIGSEWGREGYDGIETEGLCYTAHFLGFKCWGMVNESIQHTDEI